MKYIIALRVQVVVDANSPQEAEQIAFKNANILRQSSSAHVSAAVYVRKAP